MSADDFDEVAEDEPHWLCPGCGRRVQMLVGEHCRACALGSEGAAELGETIQRFKIPPEH